MTKILANHFNLENGSYDFEIIAHSDKSGYTFKSERIGPCGENKDGN